jgi:hypothetical protein
MPPPSYDGLSAATRSRTLCGRPPVIGLVRYLAAYGVQGCTKPSNRPSTSAGRRRVICPACLTGVPPSGFLKRRSQKNATRWTATLPSGETRSCAPLH